MSELSETQRLEIAEIVYQRCMSIHAKLDGVEASVLAMCFVNGAIAYLKEVHGPIGAAAVMRGVAAGLMSTVSKEYGLGNVVMLVPSSAAVSA
jgi:hypothetical protein